MFLSEIKLLLKRRRTKVLFILLLLEPWLLAFLIYQFGGGRGQGPNFLNLVTHNGIFLVLASLSSLLPLLLPLAVSLVSSDAVAGEASNGTLRYLLTAPVSRFKLLVHKMSSSLAFIFVLSVTIALSGLVAGSVFFPVGKVLLLSGQTVSFLHGVLLVLLSALLVGLSLICVVAIGIAISTFTDIPVGATLGTLGAIILSEILDNITQVRGIWPLLPTNYWMSFSDLFRSPIIFSGISKNIINQVGWLVFAFSVALAKFRFKDITS